MENLWFSSYFRGLGDFFPILRSKTSKKPAKCKKCSYLRCIEFERMREFVLYFGITLDELCAKSVILHYNLHMRHDFIHNAKCQFWLLKPKFTQNCCTCAILAIFCVRVNARTCKAIPVHMPVLEPFMAPKMTNYDKFWSKLAIIWSWYDWLAVNLVPKWPILAIFTL